ncbi:hypothetical protein [Staphylococcus hominis]
MNHEIKQSDWRTVANCLASQNYISIVKGLVHHFTTIDDEEILDKIYDDFMNDALYLIFLLFFIIYIFNFI